MRGGEKGGRRGERTCDVISATVVYEYSICTTLSVSV